MSLGRGPVQTDLTRVTQGWTAAPGRASLPRFGRQEHEESEIAEVTRAW